MLFTWMVGICINLTLELEVANSGESFDRARRDRGSNPSAIVNEPGDFRKVLSVS